MQATFEAAPVDARSPQSTVEVDQGRRSQFCDGLTQDSGQALIKQAMARMDDATLFDDASLETLRLAAQFRTLGEALMAVGAERRARFLAGVPRYA